jgi:hypothetical protein
LPNGHHVNKYPHDQFRFKLCDPLIPLFTQINLNRVNTGVESTYFKTFDPSPFRLHYMYFDKSMSI